MNNEEHNIISQNGKGERGKQYKYINERKAITKKLLELLHIDNSNKMFNSYDLDHNEETQKAILDMIPNIERYFTVAGWSYYRKNNNQTRPYISVIKSVLKDMKINVVSASKKKRIDEKIVTYSIYTISNNIDEYN